MPDDLLTRYKYSKFKDSITIGKPSSLHYARSQCESRDEIPFAVSISNICLKSWHDLKSKYETGESFITILNTFLAEKWAIQIKYDCKRLEDRLNSLSSEANSKLKGKRGRIYVETAAKFKEIGVRQGEIITAGHFVAEIEQRKINYTLLEEENKRLETRCNEFYHDLVRAQALGEDANKRQIDMDKLQTENLHLHRYAEKIEEQISFKNRGGTVEGVKERQRRRKLKELETNVEKALWFSKSFGLKLNSASFENSKGSICKMNYSYQEHQKPYNDLPEDEQDKIKGILFITDKFCIGTAAYHELAMSQGGEELPRTYL